MAQILIKFISSDYQKLQPRYECLSEAKASHWQRMEAEVSNSAPKVCCKIFAPNMRKFYGTQKNYISKFIIKARKLTYALMHKI